MLILYFWVTLYELIISISPNMRAICAVSTWRGALKRRGGGKRLARLPLNLNPPLEISSGLDADHNDFCGFGLDTDCNIAT